MITEILASEPLDPTAERDGHKVLNISTYAPFYLAALNNALSRNAGAQYRRDFGVGLVEWRVMASLAAEPGISANRINTVLKQDKAATSRSLKVLADMELVRFEGTSSDPRSRNWWLNEAGCALHGRILERALAAHEQLIANIPEKDLRVFFSVVRQMMGNLKEL